jgi:hypothetical protein
MSNIIILTILFIVMPLEPRNLLARWHEDQKLTYCSLYLLISLPCSDETILGYGAHDAKPLGKKKS